jgi:molybdopterin converting factor small subunit
MVHVQVRIFSQAIPDRVEIELEDGSTVETLLSRTKERVPQESQSTGKSQLAFLNNTGGLVVLLNGVSIYSGSGWKTLLHDGDVVSFLPMLAGG